VIHHHFVTGFDQTAGQRHVWVAVRGSSAPGMHRRISSDRRRHQREIRRNPRLLLRMFDQRENTPGSALRTGVVAGDHHQKKNICSSASSNLRPSTDALTRAVHQVVARALSLVVGNSLA